MDDQSFPTTLAESNHNDLYVADSAIVGYWLGDRATLADWQAATGEDANSISADPLFVDAAGGNFELRVGSPAIDAGENTGAPATDIRGMARPFDGDDDGSAVVDIGAFEFYPSLSIDDVQQFETDTGTIQFAVSS